MQFAVARVIGYALLALGFYISLQMVGVNLSSLAVLAGAVGVGFGFGLQNIISNFISGLIILAERPIAIGDRVEIGGVAGQVREISLRSTTVDHQRQHGHHRAQRRLHHAAGDELELRRPASALSHPLRRGLRDRPAEAAQADAGSRGRASQGVEGPQAGAVLRRLWRQLVELRARRLVQRSRPSRRGASGATCSLPSSRSCASSDIEIPFPQHDLHVRTTAGDGVPAARS